MPAKKDISTYKLDDANLIRDTAIDIITDPELKKNATGAKARVEALKVLGRVQYLFQVDKQVIRETTKKRHRITRPKLKPDHQKTLQDILKNG